jgi:hypothetical protein
VLSRGDERPLRPHGDPTWEQPTLRLPLRVPIHLPSLFVLLGLAGYGYGAAALVWICRTSADDVARTALMLVGFLVGILLATFCSASLLQRLLHSVVPARLEGDASALRVRVWNTWEGLGDGFRRTDVLVPRDQVMGVSLSIGQWGDSQLFLLHSSGLAIGTGWSGTHADAVRLSEPILRWTAGPLADTRPIP